MIINAKITIIAEIYNSTTKQNDLIYRTRDCFFDGSQGIISQKDGQRASDKAFIAVFDVDNFRQPKAFTRETDKDPLWTAFEGAILVNGDVPDGTSITDVKAQYDDIYKITFVDPKLYGSRSMQHVEIRAN